MNIFDESVVSFLKNLCKENVRFILVGGLATNFHGYSRTTGDVDLWMEDTETNRKKLVTALRESEIEGADIFLKHPLVAGFSEILLEKGIYIDLMSNLNFFKQERFDECYNMAEVFKVEDLFDIKVLHINHLIAEKEKSGRPKDLEDLMQLKKIVEMRKKG